MKCEEFRNRIPDLQKARLAEIPEAQDHVHECGDCAAELAQAQKLSVGLRLLASDLSVIETPTRVESNLLAAFRATHAIGSERAAGRRMPALQWIAAGFAAAALAAAIWIVPKRHVDQPAAGHPPAVHSQQVELASTETDDGFIPLPNAPQIDPNDDVNVVRMEFPRSAMLAVGLDVSPDQVSGTVEAEVMLGSDGLARAVRFMD
jgi:hypothetical protein